MPFLNKINKKFSAFGVSLKTNASKNLHFDSIYNKPVEPQMDQPYSHPNKFQQMFIRIIYPRILEEEQMLINHMLDVNFADSDCDSDDSGFTADIESDLSSIQLLRIDIENKMMKIRSKTCGLKKRLLTELVFNTAKVNPQSGWGPSLQVNLNDKHARLVEKLSDNIKESTEHFKNVARNGDSIARRMESILKDKIPDKSITEDILKAFAQMDSDKNNNESNMFTSLLTTISDSFNSITSGVEDLLLLMALLIFSYKHETVNKYILVPILSLIIGRLAYKHLPIFSQLIMKLYSSLGMSVQPQLGESDIEQATSIVSQMIISYVTFFTGKSVPDNILTKLGKYQGMKSGMQAALQDSLGLFQDLYNWLKTHITSLPGLRFMTLENPVYDNYLKDTNSLMDNYKSSIFKLTLANVATVDFYIDLGRKLLMELSRVRGCENVRKLIDKNHTAMLKISEAFLRLDPNLAKVKQEPTVLMLSGAPGLSKTILINEFIAAIGTLEIDKELLGEFQASTTNFVYRKQATNIYDDGYNRNCFFTVFDDFMQYKDVVGQSDAEVPRLFDYTSVFPTELHPADINKKGNLYFQSQMIIATSNVLDIKSEIIASNEALKRRIHLWYIVVPKPEYRLEVHTSGPKSYMTMQFDPIKMENITETLPDGTTSTFPQRTKEMVQFVEYNGIQETGNILTFDQVVQKSCSEIHKRRAFKQNTLKQLDNTMKTYLDKRFPSDIINMKTLDEEFDIMSYCDREDSLVGPQMDLDSGSSNYGSIDDVVDDLADLFDDIPEAEWIQKPSFWHDSFSPAINKAYKILYSSGKIHSLNLRAMAHYFYDFNHSISFESCDLEMLSKCLIRDMGRHILIFMNRQCESQVIELMKYKYTNVFVHKFVSPRVSAITALRTTSWSMLMTLASPFKALYSLYDSLLDITIHMGKRWSPIFYLLGGIVFGGTVYAVSKTISNTIVLAQRTYAAYKKTEIENMDEAFGRLYARNKWFTILNRTYNPISKPIKTIKFLEKAGNKKPHIPQYYSDIDVKLKYIASGVLEIDYEMGCFVPMEGDPKIWNHSSFLARALYKNPHYSIKTDTTFIKFFDYLVKEFKKDYEDEMLVENVKLETSDEGHIYWDYAYAQSGTANRNTKPKTRKMIRPSRFEAQLGPDKNGIDIMNKVLNNCYTMYWDSSKYTDEELENLKEDYRFEKDSEGKVIYDSDNNPIERQIKWTRYGSITGIKDTIILHNVHFANHMLNLADTNILNENRMLKFSSKSGVHRYMTMSDFMDGCKYITCDGNVPDSRLDDNDACLTQLPVNRFNMFPDISKYFVRDDYHAKMKNALPSLLVSNDVNTNKTIMNHFDSYPMLRPLPVAPSEHTHEFVVSNGYEYTAKTINGDCGSLLMLMNPQLANQKILGIHSAGNGTKGFAGKISYEDIMHDISIYKCMIEDEESPVPTVSAQMGLQNHLYTHQVNLPRRFLKSKIVLSELASSYEGEPGKFFKPTKAPAQLYKIGEIDPMAIAQESIKNNDIYLDHGMIISAVDSLSSYLFQKSKNDPETPSVWTIEQALHGIEDDSDCKGLPSSSGAGYPMANHPSTNWKKIYFDPKTTPSNKDNALKKIILEMGRIRELIGMNVRPFFVNNDCLKDEVLRIGKNTRQFSSSPFIFQLFNKEYFGSFIAWIVKNKIENGFATGINVFGMDWHILAMKLNEYDPKREAKVFAGDFKKFDVSQLGAVMWELLSIIEKFYNTFYPEDTIDSKKIRKYLFLEICQSRHLSENMISLWFGKNPSGNLLTLILNGLYNMTSHRLCWIKLHLPIMDFNNHVYIVVEGDDSVVTVSPRYRHVFNEIAMCDMMPLIGLKYTSELKTRSVVPHRSLEFVSFCKRMFVYDSIAARYIAPLDIDTIHHIPCFNKKDAHYNERIVSNVMCCLRELSLHDKKTYDREMRNLIQAVNCNYRHMIFPEILDVPHRQRRESTFDADPLDMWL